MLYQGKGFNLFVIFFMGFLFCGCVQDPAHVHYVDPESKRFSSRPYLITVENGETLYSISKKYEVSLRDLIETNHLKPPYFVYPGDNVKLPKPKYHTVKKGDTLYSISRGYSVDLSSLVQANQLDENNTIWPGQQLRMPSKTEHIVVAQYDNTTDNTPIAAAPEPYDPASRTVETGDVQVVWPNKVTDSNSPSPVLRSSDNYAASDGTPSPTLKPGSNNAYASKQSSTTIKPVYRTASLKKPTPKKKQYYSKRVSFSWPTRGKVISSYGPKKGGLYNDGINIAAPEGSSVKAADGGVVVYAGNELKGYGNLVLIKHHNGYLSAYAHNKNLLAKKGDVVDKGQVIAKVGKSGHVDSPQLHFSIRKGRKAVDPKKFLAS